MIHAVHTRPIPPPKKRRIHRKRLALACLVLVAGGVYSYIAIHRPFQELIPSVSNSQLNITTQASMLPWPNYGEGAFSLGDGKVVATKGDQTPLPTASTIKLLTALVVLQKHPLTADQDGPTITLGPNDIALYNRYVAAHGSVTPVSNGQQLTEREMLDAVLLPSANNIADSLAIWAYGSFDAYDTAARAYLKDHGLTNTTVGSDASGLAPDSTSTASDLVQLGSLAIQNPAIADSVSQPSAVIPGVGTVRNVNTLLGTNHIVGLKTGNSDQNGGVFVGAAKVDVAGKPITIITALTGAGSLQQVLRDSAVLINAIPTTFTKTTIVKAGTVLATYQDANNTIVQAVAAKDLDITLLRGSSVNAQVTLQPIDYSTKVGQQVGQVSLAKTTFADAQSVPIVLKQAPSKPSIQYRLLHP